MINFPKNMVVISPHPDDETIGVGGTIARFIENGTEVGICHQFTKEVILT